jgi:hypothetical protein
MGFGNEGDLRLLLADNYCLTTNDFTTELTERTEDAQRLFKRNSGSFQHRHPCGAVGSSARLPLDRGCLLPVSRAVLMPVAIGPGCAG